MRLSEIVNQLDDQEFMVKAAAVEEAYKNDDVRMQLLDEAIELVKAAEENGEIGPLTDSQLLSAAVQLVEDHVQENNGGEDLSKVASEEDLDALGRLAAEVLYEHGITPDDLSKVASEEEEEELGRVAAHLVAEELDSEE